jgi:MSHA biogenesis protein MshI
VGIDVRPEGVALARVERSRAGRVRLVLAEWRPTEDGAQARDAIFQAEKAHTLRGADAISVMDPSSYSLLLVEAPDVEPAELRAALRWRIKDLIDFHIDDAVIDVFDLPGDTPRGRARMMYVVAARAAAVRARVNTVEESHLHLSAIDIPELALRNVTALLPEDVGGVALLHLCEGHGLIVVTHQSSLYLARAIEFDPDPEDGGERAMETLTLEIQRSLDYYESHFGQPSVQGVVLSQGAERNAGLEERLRRDLPVAVKALELGDVLECADPPSAAVIARCLPAIGAALRQERAAL